MGRPKSPPITRDERIAKLMANVEPCPTTGCWLWTGSVTKLGYGRVCHSRKVHYAHRESYQVFVGPIPTEALDHTCNNPPCINPMHLSPCTSAENVHRGVARRMWCGKGLHLMAPPNLLVLKSGKKAGYRMCRQCSHDRNKAHRTPEVSRAYNQRDRAKHADRRRADDRLRYAANREARCAKQREYERGKRQREQELKKAVRHGDN